MADAFLLTVEDLKKFFDLGRIGFSKRHEYVYALNGISFNLKEGETLGIVGESGCGKSTAARVILRLIEPTSGKVIYNGIDIFSLKRNQMQLLRRDMQIIFQDPYSSLNPRMTVEEIVGEPLEVYRLAKGSEKTDRIVEILRKVGLKAEHLKSFPVEFSGGQRQRIGVARALILNPKLIIADEPVSSLDVSIQAQVINLLDDLKTEFHLSYIFISHDLSVVKYLSERVAVMYLGKIVEIAPCNELYENPRHPYTEALLLAVPVANPKRKKKRTILKGDVPSPIDLYMGCVFYKRCPHKREICEETAPEMKEIAEGHYVSCHYR
jgi:oligopeptide/dipeptide ABC transporter ATP-binding protein